MNTDRSRHALGGRFHLPNFCSAGNTLAVVLIVELVAIILTIARQPLHISFWIDLAGNSLFMLWEGLICAAVLCRSKAWLQKHPAHQAYLLTLLLMLCTSLSVAEATYQLGSRLNAESMEYLFPSQHAHFLLRTFAVAFIVSSLALRYFHVSAEWRSSIELEAQARIRALQARIRPHFLFNSMNTIASLTRSNPARAEQAVEDLADLFRANLNESRHWITLKEELEIARIYQRIEALRLGERLKVEWQITDLPMRVMVPSLLIQPLLENAVYHGIEPLSEGGIITVTGRFDGQKIELSVSNPIGTAAHTTSHIGHGIALDNIRQRLQLAWPDRAEVELQQESHTYRVILRFPYQTSHEHT